MRVTKIIREYVEREVRAKYSARIDYLRKEKLAIADEFNQACEKLEKDFASQIKEARDEIALKCGYVIDDNQTERPYTYHNKPVDVRVYQTGLRNERIVALDTRIKHLENECHETIEKILIDLEIGSATKSELTTMIDAVEVSE